MTRIFLIRHGATVLSAEDRFAGASDVALSPEGTEQAKKLGQRLAGVALSAVYCSDMDRTRHTAEAVAAPHQLTPIPRASLREINHGHWEGMAHHDVEQRFAAEYQAWDADPLLSAPPGGETGLAVLARSLPELARIVGAHPNQLVAVVSHKATIRLLLCSVLGIDPRLYRARIAQDTAALNVIDFRDPTQGRVMLMNDISHYRPDENLSGAKA
jgi:broad specificity phosphatase PhoE